MTTFTSEDRKNAKLVEEAPYHPGYEDAVVYPTVVVDSGASVDDREDSMQMLRDQIHTQQCEINALRKALMYTHPVKELTDEEIKDIWCEVYDFKGYDCLTELDYKFCREIIRKARG